MLIFLQATYPSGSAIEQGAFYGNIYTGDLFPVSGVHIVVSVIAIATLIRFHRSKKLRISHLMLLLLIVFIFSFLTTNLSSIRQSLIDLALFMNVILWTFVILNYKDTSFAWVEELLIIIPISVCWGSVILYLLDLIFRYNISTMYLTFSIFIYSSLLHVALRGNYPIKTKMASGLSIAAYLVISIHYLIVSKSGSGTILLLAIVCMLGLIISGRIIDQGMDKLLSIPLLLFIGFLIYIIGSVSSLTFPLEGLVLRFTSILTFDLERMNRSAAVRILELMNITHDLFQNGILHLIFGNGYGGNFTDTNFPFNNYLELSRSDYSNSELSSHQFYRPHNSPAVLLLKHGLLGISVYLSILAISIKYYLSGNRIESTASIILLFTFGIVYGFGIKNSIIIGICFGSLFLSSIVSDGSTASA
jgi:hypothetical protein